MHVACTCDVCMWRVRATCACGVYVRRVHVARACGVCMWRVHATCVRGFRSPTCPLPVKGMQLRHGLHIEQGHIACSVDTRMPKQYWDQR